MADTDSKTKGAEPTAVGEAGPNGKIKSAKKKNTKRGRKKGDAAKRAYTKRSYPSSSFEEALPLAQAIQSFASGERVRRLTLLGQLNKSPTSGATRNLISNSTRYGLTTGSHTAEWLEL